MKTTFPSKNFINDAYNAFDNRDTLQISINSSWRRKILVKEIESWAPTKKITLRPMERWRIPSVLCGLFMVRLHMIYYMALASDYHVIGGVSDNSIIIMCTPLY
ncbi:hypothetical protein GCM10027277_38470 [Pseudoduganella ginsengisoli]|uniref:Uncharacterized protein n=1 Tax=Pseudoduganella ginsengisoli TaxID=1462440 RepID=A0A6L6PY85_9BURK|nr:hypothetical protein [Pseudoduganella ginsengisoli]MTW02081.1 hypothetical protein [Pseudoduganella ginsengisoli]